MGSGIVGLDRTVVLASADPALRQRLRSSLNGLRWQVREARGGAEAIAQLDTAVSLKGDGDNADFAYDAGLLYLDLGETNKALKYAHRAYDLGAQLPGLKAKLQAAGAWRD